MKKIFLSIATFFCTGIVLAQKPAQAVYAEIGGPGLASINYDSRFTASEKGWGGRIGFGGFKITDNSSTGTAYFIPAGITCLLGKDEKNYFEIGAGMTYVFGHGIDESGNFNTTFGFLNFGYRMQPKNGGFFFRAAINPVFNKSGFFPYYGGIAFGYKF